MKPNNVPIPLLVIDRAQAIPGTQRVEADVRVAGHHGRVVLDFSRRAGLEFIEYVEVFHLVFSFEAARRTVMNVLQRVYAGDQMAFPLDLSKEARAAAGAEDIPWDSLSPEERAAKRAQAERVQLQLVESHPDVPAPGKITVHVTIRGEPHTIVAEVHGGVGRVPYSSMQATPELMNDARYAVFQLLLRLSGFSDY